MKIKFLYIFGITLFLTLTSMSLGKFTFKAERISFTVRGNGKSLVKLGIGSRVGSGHCCSGVSKDSYSTFTGEVGWVLYDSEIHRVITTVYRGMSGKTIDLRDYFWITNWNYTNSELKWKSVEISIYDSKNCKFSTLENLLKWKIS